MPDLLYFVWAILPLALLIMTLHTATKLALKAGKRDYPKNYLKEFLFTTGMFVVSIIFDKVMLAQDSSFKMMIESFGVDSRLVRWLIFPAIITIAAIVQQHFTDKKNKADNAEKLARRMKYAPK